MSEIGKTGQPKATGAVRQTQSIKIKINSKSIVSFVKFKQKLLELGREPYEKLKNIIMGRKAKLNTLAIAVLNQVLETPGDATLQYVKAQLHKKPWLREYFIEVFINDLENPAQNAGIIWGEAEDFLRLTTCNEKEFNYAFELYDRADSIQAAQERAEKQKIFRQTKEQRYQGMTPALAEEMKTIESGFSEEIRRDQMRRLESGSFNEFLKILSEGFRSSFEILKNSQPSEKLLEIYKKELRISDCVKKIKSHARKKAAAKARKTRAARTPITDKQMPPKAADKAGTKEKFENGGRKDYRPEGERGPKTRWLREFFKPMRW